MNVGLDGRQGNIRDYTALWMSTEWPGQNGPAHVLSDVKIKTHNGEIVYMTHEVRSKPESKMPGSKLCG